MSRKRYKGGRISLTAREADLLLTVASTCGDYAPESVEYTAIQPPMSSDRASEMWDRIMDKLRDIAPMPIDLEHLRGRIEGAITTEESRNAE